MTYPSPFRWQSWAPIVGRSLAKPLHRRSHPDVTRHLAFLEGSQYWPVERLREYQEAKLGALVEHSYANVPFHRERFDTMGLAPSDIRTIADLPKLPILEKEDIQKQRDRLISRSHDSSSLVENATGGSTGNPLHFVQDQEYLHWADAARIRAWKSWFGLESTEPEAVLWGSIRDIGQTFSARVVIRNVARDGVLALNTFDLDEHSLGDFLRCYNALKPRLLRGYATSLDYLAHLVEVKQLHFHRPDAIISSTEVLHLAVRRRIEHALGAPVFDSYGCREVSHIGQECETHNGLHVAMENQIVELVENDILVTNLNNHGMPFLRYRVGDRALGLEGGPCACGRSSDRIVKLMGRDNENIELPNGKVINGEFFEFLFFDYRSVRRFQVVYKTRSRQLEIGLELDGPEGTIGEEVAGRVRQLLCFENVRVVRTDGFRNTPSGKFRFVFVVDE